VIPAANMVVGCFIVVTCGHSILSMFPCQASCVKFPS
jgi:hypothetical protein